MPSAAAAADRWRIIIDSEPSALPPALLDPSPPASFAYTCDPTQPGNNVRILDKLRTLELAWSLPPLSRTKIAAGSTLDSRPLSHLSTRLGSAASRAAALVLKTSGHKKRLSLIGASQPSHHTYYPIERELQPGGYHERQGLAPPILTQTKAKRDNMYWPNSTWTWTLFLVVIGQAVIGLALEGYVFGRFIEALDGGPHTPEVRSIDTFLSLFIFGFLYEVFLTWDALKSKNTIQVIGLCAYNMGLVIYAAVQVDQIHDSIITLAANGTAITADLWPELRPFLVAVPCITALGSALISFAAWKLYDEFSWSIYKNISADVAMRKRYLVYLIYITLLKFDFFFFASFTVQFTVVVLETRDIEFALTIAALPIIIIVLFLAAFWARRESKLGMIVVMTMYLGAMAYFLFKLVRMYDSATPTGRRRVENYMPARRGLTTFAILTLLLLIATMLNAIWCTLNFGKGLEPHLRKSKMRVADVKVYPYETNVPYNGAVPLGQVTTRMTID